MEVVFFKDYMDILFCDMVISFVTLLMYFLPKRKINGIVGYRTFNSMKNQENWDFSQRFYFGKWLLAIPLIILFQILSLTLLQIKDINLIETLSMVLFFTYSIVLMVITEAKLKKLGRANLPNKEY